MSAEARRIERDVASVVLMRRTSPVGLSFVHGTPHGEGFDWPISGDELARTKARLRGLREPRDTP